MLLPASITVRTRTFVYAVIGGLVAQAILPWGKLVLIEGWLLTRLPDRLPLLVTLVVLLIDAMYVAAEAGFRRMEIPPRRTMKT